MEAQVAINSLQNELKDAKQKLDEKSSMFFDWVPF